DDEPAGLQGRGKPLVVDRRLRRSGGGQKGGKAGRDGRCRELTSVQGKHDWFSTIGLRILPIIPSFHARNILRWEDGAARTAGTAALSDRARRAKVGGRPH